MAFLYILMVTIGLKTVLCPHYVHISDKNILKCFDTKKHKKLPVMGQKSIKYVKKWAYFDTNWDALKRQFYLGNNPMVGATVAVAVAVEEAMKK